MSDRTVLSPSLLTPADVADMLDVPLRKLTWWLWVLDGTRRYREFEIERRNGEPRLIRSPIKPIKDLQRKLADALVDNYSPSTHVHGFAPGRSIVSNATPHRRQVWVMRVDIADFFPSINFGRVRGIFMAHPYNYPADVATILAQLCCHDGELPQGAPTSPVVSNLICRGLDQELATLARSERCHYTRYADDITFSTNRTVFPPLVAHRDGAEAAAGPRLVELISRHGFTVNAEKTRLTHRTQRQRVTGLVVNQKLNLPREYARSLRNLLYIWRTYGDSAAEAAFYKTEPHPNWPPDKPRVPFQQIIRGRVQYVGSIKGATSPVYLKLAAGLSLVLPDFEAPRASPFADVQPVRVYTEGSTDVDHLAAATRHFQSLGQFADLSFVWDSDSSRDGDPKLRKLLGELPSQAPQIPTVCLFDRDNVDLLRELGLNQGDWSDRGNGVVAAALVVPPFRNEPLCIEMLYSDDDLRIPDSSGRRIFLRSEFDTRSGQHLKEPCHISNPKNRTLVCDEVYEFGTGQSIALGKANFAKEVAAGTPPFDGVSFEGFRPTLEMLVEAVVAVASKVANS
jgi:RNA-directed DNA polymerase